MTKILATKRDLQGESTPSKLMKENSKGSVQIEVLRRGIQALTQATNPLGKGVEYLQEDGEGMNKEAGWWRKETERYEGMIGAVKGEDELEKKLAKIESSILDEVLKYY